VWERGRRFKSFFGDEATLPLDISLRGLGVLNSSEADVIGLHSRVSLNVSVLHFGSLKFDNIKGPYYYVLAKEALIFRF
jgi:hypothetical protein